MKGYFTTLILHLLSCICGISEIPNSLLVEMLDVNSTEDFYERFVDGGYRSFKGESLEEPEEAIGSCQPLETSVKVPAPSEAVWFTHPYCVKIKQCGGCCGTSSSCQPIKTRKRNYRVSRFKYNRNKRMLDLVKDEILNLYEDTVCGCQCKVKSSDCTQYQVFDERICECICMNNEEILDCINKDKIWDAKRCLCACKETEECSSGYVFNPITCKCQPI